MLAFRNIQRYHTIIKTLFFQVVIILFSICVYFNLMFLHYIKINKAPALLLSEVHLSFLSSVEYNRLKKKNLNRTYYQLMYIISKYRYFHTRPVLPPHNIKFQYR